MTSSERRQLLEFHGFAVSTRAFLGMDGRPLHYALELQLDGTRGNHNNSVMQGRQYSIDLESGVWNRWGTDERCAFDVGPWNELVRENETEQANRETKAGDCGAKPAAVVQAEHKPKASQVAQLDDPWLSHEFIVRCIKAGFEIDHERECRVPRGRVDFGNRFAIFNGESFLLFPATCKVVDRKFDKHELSEFVSGQAEKVVKPPTFLENRQREYAGNTKQVGLF